MLKNPCFNSETKTNCSKRCAGCAATCPDWKKYSQERDEQYEQRRNEAELNAAVTSRFGVAIHKSEKTKLQKRARGFSKY